MHINKIELKHEGLYCSALEFIPSEEIMVKGVVAVFTHGYTTEKGDVVAWCHKMVELGVPCVAFDLPGHYLGSFNEIPSFDTFTKGVPTLFEEATNSLEQQIGACASTVIFGGHSLGALFALSALSMDSMQKRERVAICVGLGFGNPNGVHNLETPFFRDTLRFREELVSKKIRAEILFPWLHKEKENMKLKNARVHMICGQDDVVVHSKGVEDLAHALKEKSNSVDLVRPKRLPHHHPELAAVRIRNFVKLNILEI